MKLFKAQWFVALGFLALAAMVMLSGCGGGGPDVEYVEGKVTLDGTPVEGVTVGFSPTGPLGGTPATGRTDANGVYRLTATGGGEVGGGVATGEYNVSFSKTEVTGGGGDMTAEETEKFMQTEEYEKLSSGGLSAPPKSVNVLPMGYANPLTSGITVTVKGGKNVGGEFDFDLKSDFQPQ
jgi:hypothetical protein